MLFNTDEDALFRLLERSFITIFIIFTLWNGFYYYENYIHANNEIFRGYDNSHSMFINQNIWNPLNFNIHQTPWHPLNPIYRKAIDIDNSLNLFHWTNPISPFNINNKLYNLVTKPFNPICKVLTNPLDLRYLYIMNR